MTHEKKLVHKAGGVRAECACGWVGKWHDNAIRGLPTADFRRHRLREPHGNDRHDQYDFGNAGEMFAHLTDDHDLPTAKVATWDFSLRVRRHEAMPHA